MPFVATSAGRIRSIKLEYNVVAHCNYGCRECSHFSPHLGKWAADLATFTHDLAALARVYHVSRFRFVGGEPLLHRDLLEFVRVVRESGIADKIQVVTNGSLLHRADDALFREIDMLSISWYPDARCDDEKIALARSRCRQHGTALKVDRIDRFRMMQLDAPMDNGGLVDDVYSSCQIAHAWYCQTLHDGFFYLCSRPILTAGYLERKGLDSPDFQHVDGVPLHEPELYGRLLAYLSRREPLAACSYCLGTVGRYFPWQQLTPAERRSAAPLERDAAASVSRGRLHYLLLWSRLERVVLAVLPSLRIARLLHLAKNAPIRD